MADKSELQATPAVSLKEPLPPVPEQGGSSETTLGTKETTTALGDKKGFESNCLFVQRRPLGRNYVGIST